MGGGISHPPHTRSGERQLAERSANREGGVEAAALARALRHFFETADLVEAGCFIRLFLGIVHVLLLLIGLKLISA